MDSAFADEVDQLRGEEWLACRHAEVMLTPSGVSI